MPSPIRVLSIVVGPVVTLFRAWVIPDVVASSRTDIFFNAVVFVADQVVEKNQIAGGVDEPYPLLCVHPHDHAFRGLAVARQTALAPDR